MQKHIREDLIENIESYTTKGTIFVKIKDDYIFYRLKGKSNEEIRELGNKITAEALIFEQQAKREESICKQNELEVKELLVREAKIILESFIGKTNICQKEKIKRLKEIKKILA